MRRQIRVLANETNWDAGQSVRGRFGAAASAMPGAAGGCSSGKRDPDTFCPRYDTFAWPEQPWHSNGATGRRQPAERHAAMTWAQRLKRVFNIDIEVCGRLCGGSCQGHRLYRGPGRHRSDTDSPAPARTGNTDSTIAGATDQGATWDIASFRWEGFQTNSTPLARKPGKPRGTSGCARSFRIDRIGMTCPTPRTGFSGQ
jgi:hypothetical protein